MVQEVTYSIVDAPAGRFDIFVVLNSRSMYARTGFATLAEAECEVELLEFMMTACGAPTVRAMHPTWQGIPTRQVPALFKTEETDASHWEGRGQGPEVVAPVVSNPQISDR